MPGRARRIIWPAAVGLLGIGLTVAGYGMIRSNLAADVYRDRLAALSERHASLARTYNRAVRRTAVTEIIVTEPQDGAEAANADADPDAGGSVSVRVRTAAGPVREIDTPFSPDGELYVDYVVLDGRLWIRRVFDERTPPRDGVVIDPIADGVDWSDPRARVGKAV